ncbi:MAG: HAD family hydrolase [Deltaproteobacteria bacterium]|nr:HAD family hydrolase [Deltaproteobacteria bacterium]
MSTGPSHDALDPAGSRRVAAVFLDRDGTLIEERELIERPDQVVILPGVAGAIRALRAAGYRIVVVTNQSAISRGRLDPDRLEAVHRALGDALRALGAPLDAIYFSPDPPDPDAEATKPSARRKPGAGMLLQAAAEHGLCLERSFMIGDQPRDALAGRRAGCRGSLLVRTGRAPLPADAAERADGIFDDLSGAVRFVLAQGEPAGD